MSIDQSFNTIHLPRSWSGRVKSVVLHVIALARFSVDCIAADHLINGGNEPVQSQISRLEQKIHTLTETMRIKDQRMARIVAQCRPRYLPIERMEILELKAVCNWSQRETGRQFQVAPATVSSWLKRVDEDGPDAILRLQSPINKFPELVRYSVTRLKTLCPSLGKVKIAQLLCRAGLHLSASTVGRIVKQDSPIQAPDELNAASEILDKPTVSTRSSSKTTKPVVTAQYPNHVWHVDMTVVPTGGGFWTPWFPFTLPQCWPFCWWVAVVMDHFSRKTIGFAVFKKQPSAIDVRTFVGTTISRAKARPKYIISDKGNQFWCVGYKRWCKRKGIKPRFGAIGKHGSIAVIERFNRTLNLQGVHACASRCSHSATQVS